MVLKSILLTFVRPIVSYHSLSHQSKYLDLGPRCLVLEGMRECVENLTSTKNDKIYLSNYEYKHHLISKSCDFELSLKFTI